MKEYSSAFYTITKDVSITKSMKLIKIMYSSSTIQVISLSLLTTLLAPKKYLIFS